MDLGGSNAHASGNEGVGPSAAASGDSDAMTTAISIEDVRREVKILKALLGHKNLVKFHDACEDANNVYIVMELCEGEELLDRILSRGGRYIEEDAKAIVVQILNVVAFCHLQGVVHRNLKPENFLFTSRDKDAPMKLIDFVKADGYCSFNIYGAGCSSVTLCCSTYSVGHVDIKPPPVEFFAPPSSNYTLWRSRMEDLLNCKDLVDPLDYKGMKPDSVKDDDWRRMNRKTIGQIRQWIDHKVYHHVAQETDAYSLWEKLENMYQAKTACNKAMLMRQLMDLGDEAEALLLLSSLLDSWETLVITLSNSAPDGKLTMAMVKDALFNEEARRKEAGADQSQAFVTETRG
ncbi:uncharacterized protein LOC131148323 [Malania oleifera]|uniref:uncharacterized protein LOC131148323 n=1 Tax=Malania oleifera TaxID=397392 RepID=UPI0025AEC94D|nr:uncharacterized protein LOC131148323 [Malania oleifera]